MGGRSLGRLTVAVVGAFLLLQSQQIEAAIEANDQIAKKQTSFTKPSRDRSVLIGHNVTPSTATPKKNTWTVGNYAVGYGLTDNLLIASSPWIWASYNTANIHLKYIQPLNKRLKVGLFGSYFESFAPRPFLTEEKYTVATTMSSGSSTKASVSDTNRYQWKSASAHFLSSYKFSEGAETNLNVHYAYFWNDDFPYSIRMDPGDDAIRDQIDITTLTSLKVPDSDFYFLIEAGALGLNYMISYLQLGGSLSYVDQDWLVQFGASYSVPMNETHMQSGWIPGRYDSRIHYTKDGQPFRQRYLQTALHPEIQFQYFF